ncbi:MAG: hypothetical protein JST54_28955 [Deltaproteobacteria bacterium]|nr:hypothetical protein [Deltaproteobacteria bacterium]
MTANIEARKLSVKQQRALEVLLVGGTDEQAAQAAQVSRQTISKWRNHHPGFADALALARDEMLSRTSARLHAATTIAVRALEEVAKDVRNPSARVSAAKAIIEFSQKALELEELEVRLTALEERLAEQKAHGGR